MNPGFGQRGVERGGGVALAHDEPIAGRVVRVGGVNAQDVKVERGEDVGARQVATRVTEARRVHHPEARAPD